MCIAAGTHLDVALGPGGVRRAGSLGDSSDDDEESDGEDGLLVDDVDLGRDGGGGETGTEDETARLGPERVGGNRVDDRRGLLIRGRF